MCVRDWIGLHWMRIGGGGMRWEGWGRESVVNPSICCHLGRGRQRQAEADVCMCMCGDGIGMPDTDTPGRF